MRKGICYEWFCVRFSKLYLVPILSAIIGTILGWGDPKIIKYFQKRREKKINENVNEISIEGDWNSFLGTIVLRYMVLVKK